MSKGVWPDSLDGRKGVAREPVAAHGFGPRHSPPIQDERHGDLLTIEEVARELRCSKAHACNVINGKVKNVSPLPAIALGRRKVILRSTLEQWKHANQRIPDDAKIPTAPGTGAVDASRRN